MHEVGIAGELIKIVLNEAEKGGLSKVIRVNVCFGELVQIVPDIFRFAFTETTKGSLAENSEVEIEIKKIEMKCRKCGNEFRVSENNFTCSNCNSSELDFIHGNEVFVKSIEGE
jgi:hydrogenase nickel incorporation protein HypA/HybF